MPEHYVFNKACPENRLFYQSLTCWGFLSECNLPGEGKETRTQINTLEQKEEINIELEQNEEIRIQKK